MFRLFYPAKAEDSNDRWAQVLAVGYLKFYADFASSFLCGMWSSYFVSTGWGTVHTLPHVTVSALKRAHDEDAQAVVRRLRFEASTQGHSARERQSLDFPSDF